MEVVQGVRTPDSTWSVTYGSYVIYDGSL